jgi:hypothetical protein
MIYVHSIGRAARYYPDLVALSVRGQRLTFLELHQRIERIAGALHQLGFRRVQPPGVIVVPLGLDSFGSREQHHLAMGSLTYGHMLGHAVGEGPRRVVSSANRPNSRCSVEEPSPRLHWNTCGENPILSRFSLSRSDVRRLPVPSGIAGWAGGDHSDWGGLKNWSV